jgi:hypothetical protein
LGRYVRVVLQIPERRGGLDMTLGDLIRKARETGDQFNTYEVPLYNEAHIEIQDVQFVPEKDTDGIWFIQMTVK